MIIVKIFFCFGKKSSQMPGTSDIVCSFVYSGYLLRELQPVIFMLE
jgi:hypothetical protein